jgi:CRISPR-associated protein Cmr2
MTNAILIFTFSPIQSFITEARRASDLFVGSRILTQLAQSAAKAIGENNLIYPAQLSNDVPNVLVARVSYESAKQTAQNAESALLNEWRSMADDAFKEMAEKYGFKIDSRWEAIWKRQLENIWEIYWAVSSETEGYAKAYDRVRRALDSTKRTRIFNQVEEPGLKDSLSGRREALHTDQKNAKDYWAEVSELPKITAAKLRPGGRERLDSIGTMKRFGKLAEKFPSVSTVATADYLGEVEKYPELSTYREIVKKLLGHKEYKVSENTYWPYDGNLLYVDSLTKQRLKTSYELENPDASLINEAKKALRALYNKAGHSPSLYYAIIQLDGDDMGSHIDNCLKQQEPEKEHRVFSKRLSDFSGAVDGVVRKHHGFPIYGGGDDVLALVPLSKSMQLAQELAAQFASATGGTASAGIAIVHHLHPLDAVLNAARWAEEEAKHVSGKNAVCVIAVRRSGETRIARSTWDDVERNYSTLVKYFADKALASGFAHDVTDESRIVTALDNEARKAVLKRLVKRHKTDKLSKPDVEAAVDKLNSWANALDRSVPKEKDENGVEQVQGFAELGIWLILARFVAQGGAE